MLIAQSTGGAQQARAFALAHGCETFVEPHGPRCVALLARGAPDDPAWKLTPVEPLFERGRVGRDAGEWLFCVGLWVPAEQRDEFLAWYEGEHLPILLECPTWDGCRFVEAAAARGCQFHALHRLSERAALDSAERARSRATPWFRRLKEYGWFDEAFTRTLYRRVDEGAR